MTAYRTRSSLVAAFALLLQAFCAACGDATSVPTSAPDDGPEPELRLCRVQPDWEREYYATTCAKVEHGIWLPGTRTCVVYTEYINLQPPKRSGKAKGPSS